MRVMISFNDASQNNSDISFIELEGEAVEIIEVLQSESLPIPKMKEAVESGGDVPPYYAVIDPQHLHKYVNFKFEDVEVGDRLVFEKDDDFDHRFIVGDIDFGDKSYISSRHCDWVWYDEMCDGRYGKVTLEKKKK